MSFQINLWAKNHLSRVIANQFPLLLQAGDTLIYEGLQRDDLPRFSNNGQRSDSRYSAVPDTKLTCKGWTYGFYDEQGFFQPTKNPLHEIFYRFNGELADNETFKPNSTNENRSDGIVNPFSNQYIDSLDLPDEHDLRDDLNYPDADLIEANEAEEGIFFDIAAYRNNNISSPDDGKKTFEDDIGILKVVNGDVYIAESILTGRIFQNNLWTVEKNNAGKRIVISDYRSDRNRDAA